MATRWPAEWDRYCELLRDVPELGFSLDISRVRMARDYSDRMGGEIGRALRAMDALEAGAIANGDEARMVGHYWLRAPDLAPSQEICNEIRAGQLAIRALAGQIRDGSVAGPQGRFVDLIHVGIGGSAVGPQLLSEAWSREGGQVAVQFLDNADPDGLDRVLGRTRAGIGRTLVSVVSKSGITPTPWHVMLELERIYRQAGLDFPRHAIATSTASSELDLRATSQNWLARLPIWEWVGGRMSITSAVGLLPAAVVGADIDAFLDGASIMDRHTRTHTVRENPAALLALAWHWLGRGRGAKNMVVLPYSDRLVALPRWIQQLVMESIGKRLDRAGRTVHQGMTVYGYKGVSDQHSYLQQLRDGPADFFVTFICIQRERIGATAEIALGATLGDHLFGGLEGTRTALYDRGRDSITVTLRDAEPRSLGALVALYERTVGLYAELIDVNCYHQPGVDKYAAVPILDLQRAILAGLRRASAPRTAEELAVEIGRSEQVETVYKILARLATNDGRPVLCVAGTTPRNSKFLPAPAVACPSDLILGPGRSEDRA